MSEVAVHPERAALSKTETLGESMGKNMKAHGENKIRAERTALERASLLTGRRLEKGYYTGGTDYHLGWNSPRRLHQIGQKKPAIGERRGLVCERG